MDVMNLIESLFRWLHVFFGILWIGLLYFFNWVNAFFAATMDAETKKKIVAGPARHAAPAFPRGGDQSGLCLVECETFRENGVVTSFDQRDEPRGQRHTLLTREVRRMTRPA